MATINLDLKGLKCPQPAMKVASQLMRAKPGDVIQAVADCSTFEADVREVCQRWKKVLVSVQDLGGGAKKVQIRG